MLNEERCAGCVSEKKEEKTFFILAEKSLLLQLFC
jgi:hypothetical protein